MHLLSKHERFDALDIDALAINCSCNAYVVRFLGRDALVTACS